MKDRQSPSDKPTLRLILLPDLLGDEISRKEIMATTSPGGMFPLIIPRSRIYCLLFEAKDGDFDLRKIIIMAIRTNASGRRFFFLLHQAPTRWQGVILFMSKRDHQYREGKRTCAQLGSFEPSAPEGWPPGLRATSPSSPSHLHPPGEQ